MQAARAVADSPPRGRTTSHSVAARWPAAHSPASAPKAIVEAPNEAESDAPRDSLLAEVGWPVVRWPVVRWPVVRSPVVRSPVVRSPESAVRESAVTVVRSRTGDPTLRLA